MDNVIPIFVSMFVAALLIFGFVSISKLNKAQKQKNFETDIIRQKESVEAARLLIAFLQINGNNKNNAEILSESYLSANQDNIKPLLEKYLAENLGHLTGWKLEVIDSKGKEFFSINRNYEGAETRYEAGSVALPVHDSSYLDITLSYGKGSRLTK